MQLVVWFVVLVFTVGHHSGIVIMAVNVLTLILDSGAEFLP